MEPLLAETRVGQEEALTNTMCRDMQLVDLETFHQSANDQSAGGEDTRAFRVNGVALSNLRRGKLTQELFAAQQVGMREIRLCLRYMKGVACQFQKRIGAAS